MMFQISTSREADVGASLWTVFKFFEHLEIEKRGNLVLVILPKARYSHGIFFWYQMHIPPPFFDTVACATFQQMLNVCARNLDLHQFCVPWNARRARKKYLKYAANKMKTKVVFCFFFYLMYF